MNSLFWGKCHSFRTYQQKAVFCWGVCVCVLVTQSYPTLCDLSPRGTSVHEILQAGISEWAPRALPPHPCGLLGWFLKLEFSQLIMLCEFQVCREMIWLYIYKYTSILFQVLFHYWLLQDTECNSLCYPVGPYCLSVLYIVVCIC